MPSSSLICVSYATVGVDVRTVFLNKFSLKCARESVQIQVVEAVFLS